MTINRSTISSQEKNSSWCLVSINQAKKKVKLVHIGRGKFKVIAGEEGDRGNDNKIIDAADIFHCKE